MEENWTTKTYKKYFPEPKHVGELTDDKLREVTELKYVVEMCEKHDPRTRVYSGYAEEGRPAPSVKYVPSKWPRVFWERFVKGEGGLKRKRTDEAVESKVWLDDQLALLKPYNLDPQKFYWLSLWLYDMAKTTGIDTSTSINKDLADLSSAIGGLTGTKPAKLKLQVDGKGKEKGICIDNQQSILHLKEAIDDYLKKTSHYIFFNSPNELEKVEHTTSNGFEYALFKKLMYDFLQSHGLTEKHDKRDRLTRLGMYLTGLTDNKDDVTYSDFLKNKLKRADTIDLKMGLCNTTYLFHSGMD